MRVDDVRLTSPVSRSTYSCKNLASRCISLQRGWMMISRKDLMYSIPSSTLPAHFLQAVMRGGPWRIR